MRIYLDHNATTPLRDEVFVEVVRVLRDRFGNPSSTHADGAAARTELERARERIAALVGAEPPEVIFTAGATESNNLALHGVVQAARKSRPHLISSNVEHPSVVEPLARLESQGCRVTRVPVAADGLLDPQAVIDAIDEDTVLVSILWANNETGVIQPMERLAEGVKAHGVLLHVDATQALGKVPVELSGVPADLLAGSGHKFNGPKGIGFLIARSAVALEPWVRGGPQERRRRGGTHNVPGAVGLGIACQLAVGEVPERMRRYAALRDRLWEGIRAKIPRVHRNGCPSRMLPNTLNVEFEQTEGDVLLEALDLEGVSASAGAACASGSIQPSHVLSAMGRTPEQARGSLRFSVGHGVEEAQIERVLGLLPELVARVREASGA
jgi:cysteine desulfurase